MNQIATVDDEQPPLQVISQSDAMIAMIERVVMDPNASIDKLERMLALKERLDLQALEAEQRAAKASYFRAMAACQAKLKIVAKASKNLFTNSMYADLAALSAAVDPIIHGDGFTTSFQPAGVAPNGDLLVRWTVVHSGHTESDIAAFPPDKAGAQGNANKTPLQASGSTYTYARRYLKLMLFDIATGDDNDGNQQANSDTISADQFIALRDLLEQSGADEKRFLAHFKLEDLHEMPLARLSEADKMLRAKIAKKVSANA
jgi:hypothetical protein